MAENAQNYGWPQNAEPSTYSLPSLSDISKARTNARQFGDGTAYALDFNVNGQNYTFVPKNVASNGGVTAGENTYLLPYFTDANNQKDFNKNAQAFDLSSNTGLANYLQSQGQSTNGYLIPSDKVSFDGNVLTQPTSTLGGSLSGLKQTGDGFSYGISGGHGQRYLTSTGEVHDPYETKSSLLGDIFGGVGQSISDFANTDLGKAALAAASIYAGLPPEASALDVSGADVVTGSMAGVAPTAEAVAAGQAAADTTAEAAGVAATPSAPALTTSDLTANGAVYSPDQGVWIDPKTGQIAAGSAGVAPDASSFITPIDTTSFQYTPPSVGPAVQVASTDAGAGVAEAAQAAQPSTLASGLSTAPEMTAQQTLDAINAEQQAAGVTSAAAAPATAASTLSPTTQSALSSALKGAAVSGGIAAATGGDVAKAALTGGAVGGAVGGAAPAISSAIGPTMTDTLGTTGGQAATSAITSAILGGTVAAVTGGDFLKAALTAGTVGGVASAAGAVSNAISSALGVTPTTNTTGGNVATGSTGTTMDASQIQAAVQAYVDAGYSQEQAAQFVADATGSNVDVVNNAVINGVGSITTSDQGAYTLASGVSQAAGVNPANITNPAGGAASGTNVITAALQAAAAQQAGQQLAAGATGAAGVLAPAYTAAGAKQAAAQTGAAQTLASAYGTAGEQQIAGLKDAQGTVANILGVETANQQPYQALGTGAASTLAAGLAPGGQFNKPFSTADMANVMPAYTFAEQQAQAAMANKMAAGGQNLSTNAVQGAGTLAAGLASQYEQQAFNQWLQSNNLSLGALQNAVATGQTSTAQLQSALQQAGLSSEAIQQAIGQVGATSTLGAAQATGAGQIGAANALAGADVNAAGATASGILGASKAQAAGTTGTANALNTAIGNISTNTVQQNATTAANSPINNLIAQNPANTLASGLSQTSATGGTLKI